VGILLGFAPFLAFFVVLRLTTQLAGLSAALSVVLFTLLRAWRAGESLKVLELGILALFGLLTLVTVIAAPDWSVGGVRLAVDGGLALISLVSQAVGRPFTLQYARQQTPRAFWSAPIFIRANQLITGAGTLAFSLFAACDAAATYVPAIPLWVDIAATLAAFAGAFWFTLWYPARLRRTLPVDLD
jgi:hypothetical protein